MIGVHTPEFAFEQNVDNVRRAVRQMRIEYPVVIDNDYAIWRAFRNHYWPALYFIDARGRVRAPSLRRGRVRAVGEDHSTTAGRSRRRRRRRAALRVGRGQRRRSAGRLGQPASPETYLGYDRTRDFASPGGADRGSAARLHGAGTPGAQSMGAGRRVDDGQAGHRSRAVPTGGSRTAFTRATCISSWGRRGRDLRCAFACSIDGQPPGAAHGLDVDEGGNGTVVEPRLYQLIRQPSRSPIDSSRSSSSTPASRRSRSRSADGSR